MLMKFILLFPSLNGTVKKLSLPNILLILLIKFYPFFYIIICIGEFSLPKMTACFSPFIGQWIQ